MLTERQQRMVDYLKSIGHGWGRYAESVEKQGWCSSAQEDTLCRMYTNCHTIQQRKSQPKYTHSTHKPEPFVDIDEQEGGDIGDYC